MLYKIKNIKNIILYTIQNKKITNKKAITQRKNIFFN